MIVYHRWRYLLQFIMAGVIGGVASYGLGQLGYGLQRFPMCIFLGLCWFSFCRERWPIYEVTSTEKAEPGE